MCGESLMVMELRMHAILDPPWWTICTSADIWVSWVLRSEQYFRGKDLRNIFWKFVQTLGVVLTS